jgi:DNA-binding NarL/FixJ family response regulator
MYWAHFGMKVSATNRRPGWTHRSAKLWANNFRPLGSLEFPGKLTIRMRILIADDNARVRQGIKSILTSREDWEICGEAQDGPEAIEKSRSLLPDLILLDISMPGMNGLDAARMLRQVTSAKILVMSQHDTTVLAPRAREAGAHGCLDKSCLSTDLIPTITRMFQEPKPTPTTSGA